MDGTLARLYCILCDIFTCMQNIYNNIQSYILVLYTEHSHVIHNILDCTL